MSTIDPRDEPDPTPPDGPDGAERPDGGGRDATGPGSSDAIDAEFARLTEGLSFDDTPLTVDDVLADAQEDDEPCIAVVATSVAVARALAGAIRLGREARTDGIDIPVGARVVDAESGALAVGDLREPQAHDLAAIVSTALQRNGVVLFWRRGDRMTATRYRNGERGEEISPALVLGGLADTVEQLLLGGLSLDKLGEGIDPSSITRTQALQWIAQGRKRRW